MSLEIVERNGGVGMSKGLPGTIVRSRTVLRRLERATREARQMIRELEKLDVEHFGRYNIYDDEVIDDEIVGEVVELLHRARIEHPGQELEIIFMAHKRGGEHDDGPGAIQRNGEDR